MPSKKALPEPLASQEAAGFSRPRRRRDDWSAGSKDALKFRRTHPRATAQDYIGYTRWRRDMEDRGADRQEIEQDARDIWGGNR